MLSRLLLDTPGKPRRVWQPPNLYTPLAYYIAANNQAAGVVADGVAVVDPNYTVRNNHFIFTEDYDLVAAFAAGVTLTAAQIDSPMIDAFNPMQVYPTNAAALTVAANPNVMDMRSNPIKIPLNEEIAFKLAGGAGGAEADFGLFWIRASGAGAQEYAIPTPTKDMPRFLAVFTCTLTITIGLWSNLAAITFTNSLRGGAYQCNGAWLVCAKALAYRINFVKSPLYQGRKMYPGNLCDTIYGNQILRFGGTWLNGLGRFNNFELPQIQVFGSITTGSATYTGYMDLSYLGTAGPDAQP